MLRTPRGLDIVLNEIARSSERSTLFWWMVDHHDELVGAAQGRRMRWGSLCQRFAELGLLDRTGKPASIRTARETWRQARATVARARARSAAAVQPAGTRVQRSFYGAGGEGLTPLSLVKPMDVQQ